MLPLFYTETPQESEFLVLYNLLYVKQQQQ